MECSRIELERPIADAISRIHFAPHSNHLLISSWDSVLRLYDDEQSVIRLEAQSEGALLDCCFQDENAAFAACSDCCVRRIDFSCKAWEKLTLHGDAVTCVEYSVESAYYLNPKYHYKHNLGTRPELLSALQVVVEKLVKSRDVQTHCMNEIKYFRESLGSFGRMVAINGRNNTLPGLLISSGLDKKVFFHDRRRPAECSSGDSITTYSDIESLSLCGLHLLIATGRSVHIYDLRNLTKPVQFRESSLEYQISCIRCFSNSQGYATGSIDGRVALEFWDPLKANELSCIFRCHPKSKDRRDHLVRVNDIKFHPSLDNFVTGDSEGHAIMWDAKSRKRLLEFPSHNNSVSSLSFNGDGQRLAVAISYTYQEANEWEESPQVVIYNTGNLRNLSKEKYFCVR